MIVHDTVLSFRRRCAIVLALCLALVGGAHAASPGAPAPAFTLPDAAAKAVALASFRGEVVYVDFWASWCAPCRKSFPWMNAMQTRYGADGLRVVAINVDKRRSDAERFLSQVPAHFTTLFDADGTTPGAYDVKAMPTSVLIDRDGNVVLVEEGFRDERHDALEARIRTLLGRT